MKWAKWESASADALPHTHLFSVFWVHTRMKCAQFLWLFVNGKLMQARARPKRHHMLGFNMCRWDRSHCVHRTNTHIFLDLISIRRSDRIYSAFMSHWIRLTRFCISLYRLCWSLMARRHSREELERDRERRERERERESNNRTREYNPRVIRSSPIAVPFHQDPLLLLILWKEHNCGFSFYFFDRFDKFIIIHHIIKE